VKLDRNLAKAKIMSGLFVEAPIGHERHNLAFAFSQARVPLESSSGEEPLRLQSDTGFSHRLER
jgi:hypothetical protein